MQYRAGPVAARLGGQQVRARAKTVMKVSYDRPSDPPRVGSQHFGQSQPPLEYGPVPDDGQVRYGGGQYTDYGQYLDSVGQPDAQQSGAAYSGAPYSGGQHGQMVPAQPVYSQPVTYGTYGAPMVVMTKTNGLANWSMIMGIVGLGGGFVVMILSLVPIIQYFASLLSLVLWIAPILAVIFGHVAKSQIKRSGEGGSGQATAGLVMGYISIGLGLLLIVFLLFVVALLGVSFFGSTVF